MKSPRIRSIVGALAAIGLAMLLLLRPWSAGARLSPERRAIRQQIERLQKQQGELEVELAGELRRIREYLAYQDQLLGIKTLRGEFASQGLADAVARTARTLYHQGLGDADLQRIAGEHEQATSGLFQQLEQQIAAAPRWPADRTPDQYRALARKELERMRAEFRDRAGRPEEQAKPLGRTANILAWTAGQPQPLPEQNPFEFSQLRIGQAVADELDQHRYRVRQHLASMARARQ